MPPQVVPLPEQEWAQAGAMMARAFGDDPQFRSLFPDDGSRPTILQPFFQMALHSAVLGTSAVDTTPSRAALAVWSPPGSTGRPSPSAMVRTVPLLLRWLRATSLGEARRAMDWGSRCNRAHRELMPGPHWWLEMLGVEPQRQGFGLGAVLVRHGLARADADNLPTYVQTESHRNAAFYGKLGFQVIEHVRAEDEPLGIPVWRMGRLPRTDP